jgi:hypothetical protein
VEKIILEGSGSSDKNISQCEAKLFGSTNIVICLAKYEYCRYQITYDEQKICTHPKKKEIVFKTEQENQK